MPGKLKRFLLRYDPPGVGLEVETDGQIDVRHMDLPKGDTVSSPKEINRLVDELISREPELLTKRRHLPALRQLLGRLYQVEIEASEDDADGKKAGHGDETDEPEEGALRIGQEVVVTGLKAKYQIYNGERAVIRMGPDKKGKGKYEVVLNPKPGEEGETLKIKGSEHLVPVAAKPTFAVGSHVAIRGLRNHIELNGCLGRVVECYEESHRYEVRATESGQLFRVKMENLIPIDSCPQVLSAPAKENREPNVSSTPRTKKDASSSGKAEDAPTGDGATEMLLPGSSVQLVGLKTAVCYNGQHAEVLSVDHTRCRYEIRLSDGSVKTIRAENVKLVSGPPQQSSRTRRADQNAGGAKGKSGSL